MTRFAVHLPISTRLALGYAFAVLGLVGAFAVFSYAGFHQATHRSFDRHLEHELRAVVPLVEVSPEGVDVRRLAASTAVAMRQSGPAGTYVRVADAAGRVVYESPNLAGQPPLPALVLPGGEGTSQTWAGGPARSMTARAAGGAHVEVTGFEWSRHGELREMARLLALGVLGSVLAALGAGWWLARRALRPVAVITTAAAELAAGGGALGGRLPSDFATRDELTRLAETVNGLLARLEASVERERRFTANAAHELLTPIATLRSEAEVALRRERDGDSYRTTLAGIVDETVWMAATVQNLLRLARAEALAPRPGAKLDLSALVDARAERQRAGADARGVQLTVAVEPGVWVAADAEPLAEVVDNLVANAVKYTPAGGRVHVRLSHAGPDGRCRGETTLEVADTGAGFDAATGERLFERFFRADTPEVKAEPGSGLGLAIVSAIAERSGGTVRAESDGPGRGATFRVTLPCLGVVG